MTENKPKTRVQKLIAIQHAVAELLQEEVRRCTQDREYKISTMQRFERPSKVEDYSEDFQVKPGELFSFFFATEHVIPGSGVEGIPESVETTYGVERPFIGKHLFVNDADAANFVVLGLYFGANLAFGHVGEGVTATRFAESAEKQVTFTRRNVVDAGAVITVQVKNISDKPSTFRARVVGQEIAVPEPEPDVFPAETLVSSRRLS